MTFATVAHESPGRLRLRVMARRGDRVYFDGVRRVLLGGPGVSHVSVSALTGSVLILHEGPTAAVMSFAEEQRLFDVAAFAPPDTFTNIREEVRKLDERLRAESQDRWGVQGLAFYGLVGAGVWQVFQGRVLPPTVTLWLQAINLFKQALEAERSLRGRRGSDAS